MCSWLFEAEILQRPDREVVQPRELATEILGQLRVGLGVSIGVGDLVLGDVLVEELADASLAPPGGWVGGGSVPFGSGMH